MAPTHHIGSSAKKHIFPHPYLRLPITCFPIPHITVLTATDRETHKRFMQQVMLNNMLVGWKTCYVDQHVDQNKNGQEYRGRKAEGSLGADRQTLEGSSDVLQIPVQLRSTYFQCPNARLN